MSTILDTVDFSIVVESDGVSCDSIYWYVGDGTVYDVPSFTHTYDQPGLYGITMVAYQCGDYYSQYWEAFIEAPASVENIQNEIRFKRISFDTILIENGQKSECKLELLGMNGQLIQSYAIQEKTTFIQLPKLPGGIYLLRTNDAGKSNFRFQY